jgi:hypothetical protein
MTTVHLAIGKQKKFYEQTKNQTHDIQPTTFPVILAKIFVRTF